MLAYLGHIGQLRPDEGWPSSARLFIAARIFGHIASVLLRGLQCVCANHGSWPCKFMYRFNEVVGHVATIDVGCHIVLLIALKSGRDIMIDHEANPRILWHRRTPFP